MTPDGKHAIAGTLFDAGGKNVTAGALEKMAGKPMADALWGQLGKSHCAGTRRPTRRRWPAGGRDRSATTV